MTRPALITQAALQRTRAVLKAGDTAKITSPNGIVIEITAGDGDITMPTASPAQRAAKLFSPAPRSKLRA
jgi:hypothetical protein